MTYTEALAEARLLGPIRCSDAALMAQWLATNTHALIGAASPSLIWAGAQRRGMTAEALAELTHRDPMAAANLMIP